MLKTRKRWISLLVTLAMLVAFVVPFAGTASAGAASYTAVTVIPKFDAGADSASRLQTATIQIKLDPAIAGVNSAKIEVLDSSGAQLDIYSLKNISSDEVVADSVYVDGNVVSGSVYDFGSAVSSFELKFTATGNDAAKLNLAFVVDAKDCADGDIKVNVYNAQGQLEDGSVVVARATGSNVTVAVVGDPPTIGEDVDKAVTIRITENAAGAIKEGDDSVKIKLPAGFKWVGTPTPSSGHFIAQIDPSDSDNRTLIFGLDNKVNATTIASTFDIKANVAVDDKDTAKKGDVVATVEGNNDTTVSPSEITIATYADYGTDIKVDSVKTLLAGKTEQKTDKIHINENIAGSFITGRRLTIEFPEWVKITRLTDPSTDLQNADVTFNSDRNKVDIKVQDKSDKIKYEFKAELSIEGNHSGDLEATVSGAGVEETKVVVAKVDTPVKVTAGSGDVKIGVQDQPAPDITITETAAGAIEKTGDAELYVVLPQGASFASKPTVTVTDGDLSIKEQDISITDTYNNDDTLSIPIKSESVKASTIKISGIKLTLDRTVPEGALVAKVEGVSVVENTDDFDTDYALKFTVANCVTPAPGEQKGTAVFKIGQASYTLNGNEVTMDAAPYIKNGRTMVPVRFAANAVGVPDANIIWDAAARKVTVIKGDRVVQMTIGSNVLLINGAAITMDAAPEISNDRTMLPIRFLGQALGAEFVWDEATQTVTVNF